MTGADQVTSGGVSATRRPGRPRDARVDALVLEVAAELLARVGAAGFTVDAVAAAAGVGKATIYRRWPTRATLMLDAAHRLGLEVTDPDTGSLRDDLVALLTSLAGKIDTSPSGRLLATIIGEAAVNDEMRELLSGFVSRRRAVALTLVERGIARGELPSDTDPRWLLDLLGSPLFFRFLTGGQALEPGFIEWAVDAVLGGLAGGARRRSPG